MNPRVLIPLIVIAVAALFGWRQYQNCAISLPGIDPPPQCKPGFTVNPPPPTTPTPPITPTPPVSPPPAIEPPPVAPPPPTTPPATPPATPTPPVTPPPTPPTSSGPPELNLTTADVNPVVNLRPERAAILEAYQKGEFADALARADEWLNSRPTDALMALVRSNALQRQRGGQTITIGASLPTSGASFQAGEAVLQGINMAVQEANRAGGVRNRTIIVEVRNDQNNRTRAIEAASALVGDRAVIGVIGPVNSSSSIAAADIYNGSVAHLLPTATDDRLANAGPWTYRMAPTNGVQGRALARIANQRGYTRVPVYTDPNDAYSKSLSDAFVREATTKGVSAYPVEFKSGELPPDTAFDTFNDSPRPDAAFIAGAYQDVARIAKAIREKGFDVPLIAGDAAYSQAMLQEGGSAVEGLTLVSFFHATATDVGNTASFVKTFAARYGGGTPNARAAQAYDATRTLLEAIRRAATLDRAGIKAALDTFTSAKPGAGVTSSVVFANGGIQGRPFVVIEVKNGKLEGAGTVK
jgi:branched-chain amino acid transport system substrate-binding protein